MLRAAILIVSIAYVSMLQHKQIFVSAILLALNYSGLWTLIFCSAIDYFMTLQVCLTGFFIVLKLCIYVLLNIEYVLNVLAKLS